MKHVGREYVFQCFKCHYTILSSFLYGCKKIAKQISETMHIYNVLSKGVFFYKVSTLKKQNSIHRTFEEGKIKRKKRMVDLFGLIKKFKEGLTLLFIIYHKVI